MSVILFPEELTPTNTSRESLGGKALALARLYGTACPIPPWFVLTPQAFYQSLNKTQQDSLDQAQTPEDFASIFRSITLSPAVRSQLQAALARLCPHGQLVAVRSSAVDEDGYQQSFAGQLESRLYVAPTIEAVLEAVHSVWSSGFTPQVFTYRQAHNLPRVPRVPAILVQQMVHANVSGVAFSADPVLGEAASTLVSAVYGAGTALVSGECDADTYTLNLVGQVVRQQVANKEKAYFFASGHPQGMVVEEVPEDYRTRPCLEPAEVYRIGRTVHQIARFFGLHQDMEWVIDSEHNFYVVQARPITTFIDEPPPAVWGFPLDNSDLVESWGGVVTPLTASFACRFYGAVYRQFCTVMGTPSKLIEANAGLFQAVVVEIYGRLYTNLHALQTAWNLIPGFAKVHGLLDPLLDLSSTQPVGWRKKPGLLLFSLWRMWRYHRRVSQHMPRFHAAITDFLASPIAKCDTPQALAQELRRWEETLFVGWQLPLLNNFLATVYYALLRQHVATWCGESGQALENQLLAGDGQLLSIKPLAHLQALSQMAAEHPQFVHRLCEASDEDLLTSLGNYPSFKADFEQFLTLYGNRCAESLKLETPNTGDEPVFLLRTVGHQARRGGKVSAEESQVAPQQRGDVLAQAVQAGGLRGWIHRRILQALLKLTQDRVRDRENSRYFLTCIVGRIRQVAHQAGKCLVAEGHLTTPADVFYLDGGELYAWMIGQGEPENFRAWIAGRKRLFEKYQGRPAVALAEEIAPELSAGVIVHEGQRRGQGCSSGVVSGPARLVTEPQTMVLKGGEILVARQGDPGLILLFAQAGGLVLEQGNPLSHLAIVAREMGIPVVVSVPGVFTWIEEGEPVEIDGSTGIISKSAVIKAAS